MKSIYTTYETDEERQAILDRCHELGFTWCSGHPANEVDHCIWLYKDIGYNPDNTGITSGWHDDEEHEAGRKVPVEEFLLRMERRSLKLRLKALNARIDELKD